MARPVKDGISLLVGAGIGVGLMYLLDPELGAKRRQKIQSAAGGKVSGARDAASHFASSARDHVPSIGSLVSPAVSALKEAYEHLSDEVHGRIDTAHEQASDAFDHARSNGQSVVAAAKDKLDDARAELLDRLSKKANELAGPAKAKYAKLLKEKTLEWGRDEDHHYVGQTACALSSLALGAGIVYFLDPDKGHDRRDNMAAKVSTTFAEIGTFFRKVGTRLVHRGQDLATQATDHLGDAARKVTDLKEEYLGEGSSGAGSSDAGQSEAPSEPSSQPSNNYSPMQ